MRISLVLFLASGCAAEVSLVPNDGSDPPPLEPYTSEDASGEATWPSEAQFAETEAALPRPWTLAFVRSGGARHLALARRVNGAWELAGFAAEYEDTRPADCAEYPCAWPASVVPDAPLEEPPALPADALNAVAYARTLLDFEGPLLLDDEETFSGDLPWSAEISPRNGPDLTPYLEALRRYQPVGGCSMDTAPQQVALMRATAAAQSHHTGWAVQGWIDTVGYWSSSRVAWSSYGQEHPREHLELLELVGVDPERLLIGVVIDLPGQRGMLHLADVRRVVPDLGPEFAAELRRLAGHPGIDPFNRALLTAAVAELPIANDPLYASLPAESRALIDLWSR